MALWTESWTGFMNYTLGQYHAQFWAPVLQESHHGKAVGVEEHHQVGQVTSACDSHREVDKAGFISCKKGSWRILLQCSTSLRGF